MQSNPHVFTFRSTNRVPQQPRKRKPATISLARPERQKSSDQKIIKKTPEISGTVPRVF